MFDSELELSRQIELGEDSRLELKEVRFSGQRVTGPSREALADELAAFANAEGGVCVLGVDDKPRTVTGIPLENLDSLETFVREICAQSIKPQLLIRIERMRITNGLGAEVPILKLTIPRSLFVHNSPGGYFHRMGSSKREMSPDYLARLFQQRSQSRMIRFDEMIVGQSTLSDLDEALWRRFLGPYSALDEPAVTLIKLGLARPGDDSEVKPTLSGILLASRDPRRFLPNAYIQAVAYRGRTAVPDHPGPYQLDAQDCAGPLDQQVAEALSFVARNMSVRATKVLGRVDQPQYDLTAVLEALVNAVAHRDYSIQGSKIRLRMYSDRLEFLVPGALANTMTVDSLPLRQSVRNEVITSLLARCPLPHQVEGIESERRTLMDRRGEGVLIILTRTEKLSGQKPTYQIIDQEELRLTIPASFERGL
jgi:ATP-dependent DNA helicase RecG